MCGRNKLLKSDLLNMFNYLSLQRCGMRVKDYIVAVGGVDTKWAKHDAVVTLVKQASLR